MLGVKTQRAIYCRGHSGSREGQGPAEACFLVSSTLGIGIWQKHCLRVHTHTHNGSYIKFFNLHFCLFDFFVFLSSDIIFLLHSLKPRAGQLAKESHSAAQEQPPISSAEARATYCRAGSKTASVGATAFLYKNSVRCLFVGWFVFLNRADTLDR